MVSASRAQPQQVQGVPPYGLSWQVLAKGVDTSYADGWMDLPPCGSMQGSTAVTQPLLDVRAFCGVAAGTLSVFAGTVNYVPVWLERSLLITNIAFWITGVTAGNIMTYGGAQCLSSGMPGPIIGSASQGNFQTTGFLNATSGAMNSFTLPAGWSYLWMGNSGSSAYVQSSLNLSTQNAYLVPQMNLGNAATPASTPGPGAAWAASGVGGVAPGTNPSVSFTNTPPLLYFQGR